MKKLFNLVLVLSMAVFMLVGCGGTPAKTEAPKADAPKAEAPKTEAPKAAAKAAITVVSREEGSGTRGAFVELLKVEGKNADGKKVDQTVKSAEITNSTAVMLSTVAGNKNAIGYISLGTLNDTVKALKVNGVAPSVATIKDGTYKISRPFNIATGSKMNKESEDFIKYIMSDEGQAIVEKKHYISVGDKPKYTPAGMEGKIVVAGSSSVTPLMEALKEGYIKHNPKCTIEVQQSDSTTGMTSAKEGVCNIGMASRELKESEIAAGLKPLVIAIDGIAIIANKENAVDSLSDETIKNIYLGNVKDWSEAK